MPADSTGAACCNVRDFGTPRWQLSNKDYTDCRSARKGRDVSRWHRVDMREHAAGVSHTKALNPVMDLPTISVFISLVPS
jgi:hypothetical protein